MGNTAGTLVAAQVVTWLGLILGPLFPIIGQFMVDGVKSWVAWVFIVLLLLFVIVPPSLMAAEDKETAAKNTATLVIVCALIYFGLLIYAIYHVMADFRVVNNFFAPAVPAVPSPPSLSSSTLPTPPLVAP
jgi:hypothetical protein